MTEFYSKFIFLSEEAKDLVRNMDDKQLDIMCRFLSHEMNKTSLELLNKMENEANLHEEG